MFHSKGFSIQITANLFIYQIDPQPRTWNLRAPGTWKEWGGPSWRRGTPSAPEVVGGSQDWGTPSPCCPGPQQQAPRGRPPCVSAPPGRPSRLRQRRWGRGSAGERSPARLGPVGSGSVGSSGWREAEDSPRKGLEVNGRWSERWRRADPRDSTCHQALPETRRPQCDIKQRWEPVTSESPLPQRTSRALVPGEDAGTIEPTERRERT